MDVSVIIVNYNTRQLLCDCLESILKKTNGIDYEVIVVDNASKDDSREAVETKFPWVRWIQSSENLGFGKANNLGMKYAKGKYFFFLNSDTILINNALWEFYKFAEANTGYGALGCILCDRNLKACHSYGKFPTEARSIKELLAKYIRCLKDKKQFKPDKTVKPINVDYITGADLWVPRAVTEEIGGFDPSFFMYFEETDWQLRMKNAGLRRIVIPGPEIIHLEGGSDDSGRKLWSETRLRNFYASQKTYQKKHFNKWTYPLYRLIYTMLNIPNQLITPIIRKKNEKTDIYPSNERTRASRKGLFSKIKKIILFAIANNVPMSMRLRAKLYRLTGAQIGKDCLLGPLCMDSIYPEDIEIGDNCTITKGVVLLTHFYDTKILSEHAYYRGSIKIGNNCYIGMNTIFSKSVTVGNGAVIGAGSVVTKDIPPYEVWAGVPAKCISKRYDENNGIPDIGEFKPF